MDKIKTKKIEVFEAKFEVKTERTKIDGFKQYQLSKGRISLFLEIDGKEKRIAIDIPAGFICDSTSLPWAKDSAGDVHDFGYCTQSQNQGYTRYFWDRVYYLLMLDLGYWDWQAYWRYLGVRIFGALPYRRRRREKYQMIRARAIGSHLDTWGV